MATKSVSNSGHDLCTGRLSASDLEFRAECMAYALSTALQQQGMTQEATLALQIAEFLSDAGMMREGPCAPVEPAKAS